MIRSAASLALLGSLALAACDGKPATPPPAAPQAQPAAHAGEEDEEKNMNHLPAKAIGPVKVGLGLPKTLTPGGEAHCHAEVEGSASGKLRLWIGAESGEGAAKVAADLSPGEKHLEVELPKSLAGAKVWVEVESGGKTERAGFDLP